MESVCYCVDGTCEFCIANLYAAIQDARLKQIEIQIEQFEEDTNQLINEFVDENHLVNEADLDDQLESYVKTDDLENQDELLTEGDVEKIVNDTLVDFDLSDYVTKEEVEEQVTAVLEDVDIVREVAAGAGMGAAQGAMKIVDQYHQECEKLLTSIEQWRKLDSVSRLTTFWSRLMWLLTGRIN